MPEDLQRRQPRSRGAHYSPGQETIQKPPRVPETRSEALCSHDSRAPALCLCRACARGRTSPIGARRARAIPSRLPGTFAAEGVVRPLVPSRAGAPTFIPGPEYPGLSM